MHKEGVAVMIFLGHTNSFKTVFFRHFQTGSAFPAIVLVKVVEPIEGTKAAQMGIPGTGCRDAPECCRKS